MPTARRNSRNTPRHGSTLAVMLTSPFRERHRAMDKDDDTDRYWMHAIGSKKNSTPKDHLPMNISRGPADPHRSDWIRKCAQQILGSYRRDDFADPDVFLVQLAMVLERYPDKVID